MSYEEDDNYRQARYEAEVLKDEMRRGSSAPYSSGHMQHLQEQLDIAESKMEHAKQKWIANFGGVDG
jgi:hypothetical protein